MMSPFKSNCPPSRLYQALYRFTTCVLQPVFARPSSLWLMNGAGFHSKLLKGAKNYILITIYRISIAFLLLGTSYYKWLPPSNTFSIYGTTTLQQALPVPCCYIASNCRKQNPIERHIFRGLNFLPNGLIALCWTSPELYPFIADLIKGGITENNVSIEELSSMLAKPLLCVESDLQSPVHSLVL